MFFELVDVLDAVDGNVIDPDFERSADATAKDIQVRHMVLHLIPADVAAVPGGICRNQGIGLHDEAVPFGIDRHVHPRLAVFVTILFQIDAIHQDIEREADPLTGILGTAGVEHHGIQFRKVRNATERLAISTQL